jgi:hypothetical protein
MGHKVHPSIVPRVELLSDAYQSSSASDNGSSSYVNMSSTASNHSQSSYDSAYTAQSAQSTKQNRQGVLFALENDNPFAPLRYEMNYAITHHDDQASNSDAPPPPARQWEINPRRTNGKGKSKNAYKGKSGKDPNWNEAYSIAPPFGDATARILAITLYNVNDFFQYEKHNHYHVHTQRVYEKSTAPGMMVQSPSDAFVRQRLSPVQS